MHESEILKLPEHLDETIENLVKRSYGCAVEDIDEEEILYIESRITHKLKTVNNIRIDWVVQLANIFECLFGLIKAYKEKKLEISKATYRSIGAALFYFINPYDIIPDHEPQIGYLDDYYVMILCINSMCAQDRKLVLNELKLL